MSRHGSFCNRSYKPPKRSKPFHASRRPRLSSSSSAAAATAEMSPVNGELVNKLDSKTAKNGDSVVVQTKTAIKTPDGTEIPKGSKVVGPRDRRAAEPVGPEFPNGAGV